jgi:hypothetical protein
MAGNGGNAGTEDLAEVIARVREELEQAQRQGERSGLKFLVDRVALEFTVQVRREGTGKGALRIGVVTAEAGGGISRDTTHTMTVELVPRRGASADEAYGVFVGGESGGTVEDGC